MSKQIEKALVPELRFPEFRDAGEWEEKVLVEVCSMQAGKFVRAADINELKKSDSHPCYGGNGLRGFIKTFTHTGKYSLIGRQGALCGNITLATGRFHATEHAVVTIPKENVDTDWLFYKLIHLNLNQYATGQAQPGLSVDNLARVVVEIPKKEKEQQKIADCLSSIDELITAHTQKHDALKAHKKGLMQQLFPAVGETVPKLRFSEFLDKKEWRELHLSDAVEIIDSLHETPKQYVNTGYPMIRVTDVKDTGLDLNSCLKVTKDVYLHFIKRYKPQLGDIVFSRVGTCGESILIDFESDVCLGQNILLMKPKENYQFLLWYLKSNLIKDQVKRKVVGSSHKTLSIKDTKKFDIHLPCVNEQQKIADFLSSIDDIVTAQAQKIESLKAHKKGLMQQLFPAVDKVHT